VNRASNQRPLSILHTESSIGWGGQEIRILTEARGMMDRGHRVTLITPSEAEIAPAAEQRGIPVVKLPITQKRIGALFALRDWLNEHAREYDVVNTHSSTDSWLTALSATTLSTVPPIVRTRHVSTAINNRWSTRWLYRHATAHIVTTGEALRVQLNRDNGMALAHMTSVRTGIDLTRFRPLDQTAMRVALGVANRPTIGILATLRDWKGHDYLLDALKHLRLDFPGWQLLVIGDGPQRGRLEMRVHDEALVDMVRFVGNVDNVPEWLATIDLFALPSYGDEGVPQGIMQAMACGVPVVSTTVGAINEAVQDGLTGFMVPPRDTATLSDKLRLLMHDAALRKTMGAAALQYARDNFGIDVMLDRMTAVFEQYRRGR
jgi:glycosyltransferase involved in cell wall biosynthesis